MMEGFVWPSDRARAENHELNRVCEHLEEVLDELEATPSRGSDPTAVVLNAIQADALNVMQRYKQTFSDLYNALGQFLDAEDGEGSSVDIDKAWSVFNSAPGPVYWNKIESAIKSTRSAGVQVVGRVAHLDDGQVICHLNSEGRKLPDHTALYAGGQAGEKLAKALHYPDCWDTMAYPTLEDAVWETVSGSGCSVCRAQPQPAVPEGWKLVPIEPTETMMRDAADNLCGQFGVEFVRPKEQFARAVYRELLRFAPATPTTPQADGCEWHTDGNGCWMGACGKEFWFEDGGPSDNGMKFCLSCGKPCVEVVDNETGGDQ